MATFYACPICGQLQRSNLEIELSEYKKVTMKCKACKTISENLIYK